MQIVIDINDKVYGLLKYFEEGMGLNDKKDDSDDVKTALVRAVINGTPLPKGHGRLVDVNEVEEYLSDIQCELDGWGDTDKAIEIAKAKQGLDSITTIIEADKGESEG